MSVVYSLVPRSSAVRREDLLSALGLDDDGSPTWEIGRPETGATCLLVDDAGRYRLHVPLLRSPTSARDLLPSLIAAAASLDATWGDEDPLALWDRLHEEACRSTPRLPHLPREQLLRLHGWLLAVAATPRAARPLLALDPPTRVVVGLPDDDGAGARVLLPPFDVLANVDATTRIYPVGTFGPPRSDGFVDVDLAEAHAKLAAAGEPLGDVRVLTPVEIVDTESLG